MYLLQDSNSNIFTPWKLNTADVTASAIKGDNAVDNIERIDVNAPVSGNYTLTVTHKGTLVNGAQPFSLILTGADLTLSAETKTLSNIKVWPVPASDKLNIDFKVLPEGSRIKMYNIYGNIVYQSLITNPKNSSYTIDISKFSKGIYLLNISNSISTYNKKIIIK